MHTTGSSRLQARLQSCGHRLDLRLDERDLVLGEAVVRIQVVISPLLRPRQLRHEGEQLLPKVLGVHSEPHKKPGKACTKKRGEVLRFTRVVKRVDNKVGLSAGRVRSCGERIRYH